jgi:hypothetical protein
MRLASTIGTIRVANSTPIVLFSSVVKMLRVKRDKRLDFPTPITIRIRRVSRVSRVSRVIRVGPLE